MAAETPLPVALIGTGARSSYLYGPLVNALPQAVQLVSVWGRSESSARTLGTQLGVPWFTDVSRLVRETSPRIGIVCVSGQANGQVGLLAVKSGLNVLLETPIAYKLEEADAIIEAAHAHGLSIEVAEQFHRRPKEQIKLRLIARGLLGKVYSSFSDFAGHGYHGVSVMRSYLGFDARPRRVTAVSARFALAPHWSRLAETRGSRVESQDHALVEFEGGQIGVFHWTDVGYDSPLRWWRSSRFLAEKGMGISVGVGIQTQEWISLLAPDGEAPHFITMERRLERVDGGALVSIVAHTGDPATPTVTWENPFRPLIQGHGVQWSDDEIGVAGCLMSLVDAVRRGTDVTYGPYQARLDQELCIAMQRSAANGSQPVELPIRP
ncbi:MAG TPA: Gfo/Idh/MocA family oxidoreductase [Spirochaetia bacterium]|nr:Gfo/Idh/MocA family oxidoreductase [Spirochaetia bacterium]